MTEVRKKLYKLVEVEVGDIRDVEKGNLVRHEGDPDWYMVKEAPIQNDEKGSWDFSLDHISFASGNLATRNHELNIKST